MKTKSIFLICAATALTYITACSASNQALTTTPEPMTATLPPTSIPPTETEIPATATAALPTQDPNCTDKALFVADMTIPDETVLSAGEAFVKTWKLRNVGTCTWSKGYALVFASGDQMNSALSTPLSETPPDTALEISVDLVAPNNNGVFTGIYQLKNANGKVINVGELDHIWLKIVVENGAVAVLPTTANISMTSAPAGDCSPERNASYESEILTLVNQARASNGLPALSLNALLGAAANVHSADMACNSLISHTGTDGSSVASRVAAQGYASSYSVENIYAGGTAQDAFNWWMSDQIHRDAILARQVSEIGVGYAYVGSSTYGGYFAVDFASP